MGENARAYVYIARTSDKTYLQKYDFYDYQPYLDSGAKLELFGQTSYVVADTHIFQELRQARGNQHSISGNILPNIRGTYQTDPFFKETYLNLSSDILGVSGDDSNSQRLIGEARIISPWTLWFGNRVTASVAARYDIYNFDKTPIYENGQQQDSFSGVKSRFLPSGYVEWGLPLYSVKNTWTYIIEPRARLTIMQHTNKDSVFAVNNDSAGRFLSDTTLFSNNRFGKMVILLIMVQDGRLLMIIIILKSSWVKHTILILIQQIKILMTTVLEMVFLIMLDASLIQENIFKSPAVFVLTAKIWG